MAKKNSNTAPATKEAPSICAVQHSADAMPKRRTTAKIKAVAPPPKDVMTAGEVRILAAYRKADDFTRKIYLGGLEKWVDDHPIKRPAAPLLRLV